MKKKLPLLLWLCLAANIIFAGQDSALLKYNQLSVYWRDKDAEKALFFSTKALDEITESTPDTLKGIAYKNMGLALYFNGAMQEAIESYEHALDCFGKAHFTAGIYDCYNNIAAAFKASGDYGKAMNYNEKALRINKTLNNPENFAITYHNIGEIYQINYRYMPAIYYYLIALGYELKLKNNEGLAETYMNLGAVLEENGLYRKALTYYTGALKLFLSTGNLYRLGQCHNNLGVLYTRMGDYYVAKAHFESSLTYKDSVHHTEGKITSLINSGNLCMVFDDTIKALQYYREALQLQLNESRKEAKSDDLNRLSPKTDDYFFFWVSETANEENYSITAQNLFNKGYINYILGERTDAIACFLNSLEIAEFTQQLFLVRDNCKYLSASYEELKDYEKALHYAKRVMGINDSIQAQSINDILNISAHIPPSTQNTLTPDEVTRSENNSTKHIFIHAGLLLVLLIVIYVFKGRLFRVK